jgi:hypothetical protein
MGKQLWREDIGYPHERAEARLHREIEIEKDERQGAECVGENHSHESARRRSAQQRSVRARSVHQLRGHAGRHEQGQQNLRAERTQEQFQSAVRYQLHRAGRGKCPEHDRPHHDR